MFKDILGNSISVPDFCVMADSRGIILGQAGKASMKWLNHIHSKAEFTFNEADALVLNLVPFLEGEPLKAELTNMGTGRYDIAGVHLRVGHLVVHRVTVKAWVPHLLGKGHFNCTDYYLTISEILAIGNGYLIGKQRLAVPPHGNRKWHPKPQTRRITKCLALTGDLKNELIKYRLKSN